MVEAAAVAGVIRDALAKMPLASAYLDEQRDLQPHIQAVLQESLRQSFPAADLRTTISIGGTGKPCLKLLGTSFWPDIEVTDQGTVRLVAIEVKRIRAGGRPSNPIAEAIGQAIIYSICYPQVFTFIVHYGLSDEKCHDEDVALEKRLSPCNVEIILRRLADGIA